MRVARWLARLAAVGLLGAWLFFAAATETDHPQDDSRVFWAAAVLCAACAGLGLVAARR